MFNFMKSTRSIAVVIFATGLNIGLFMGKVTPELYAQVSILIFTAYFAKRDTKAERGEK